MRERRDGGGAAAALWMCVCVCWERVSGRGEIVWWLERCDSDRVCASVFRLEGVRE